MKTKRIINAVTWIVIAMVLSALVYKEWSYQGCDASSLLIAIAFYSGSAFVFGFTIDQVIVEHYKYF